MRRQRLFVKLKTTKRRFDKLADGHKKIVRRGRSFCVAEGFSLAKSEIQVLVTLFKAVEGNRDAETLLASMVRYIQKDVRQRS